MSTSEGLERGYSDGMAIGRTIGNAVTYLFMILSRPLTLLTQVIYRKSMGERYFTPIAFLIGLALIGVATFMAGWFPVSLGLMPVIDQSGFVSRQPMVLKPLLVTGVGLVWMGIFVAAYLRHNREVKKRYSTGERWHSMNSGIPRVAVLVEPVQYLISGLVAFGLWYVGFKSYGALVGLSVVVGMLADQAARKRFWNSVLDAVDSQIESEHLGKAVTERLSPGSVEGLEAPVPVYVSEEWRRRNVGAVGGPEIVVTASNRSARSPDPQA